MLLFVLKQCMITERRLFRVFRTNKKERGNNDCNECANRQFFCIQEFSHEYGLSEKNSQFLYTRRMKTYTSHHACPVLFRKRRLR